MPKIEIPQEDMQAALGHPMHPRDGSIPRLKDTTSKPTLSSFERTDECSVGFNGILPDVQLCATCAHALSHLSCAVPHTCTLPGLAKELLSAGMAPIVLVHAELGNLITGDRTVKERIHTYCIILLTSFWDALAGFLGACKACRLECLQAHQQAIWADIQSATIP